MSMTANICRDQSERDMTWLVNSCQAYQKVANGRSEPFQKTARGIHKPLELRNWMGARIRRRRLLQSFSFFASETIVLDRIHLSVDSLTISDANAGSEKYVNDGKEEQSYASSKSGGWVAEYSHHQINFR